MQTKLFFWCFCALFSVGNAQLVFKAIPGHMQMIPRNTHNIGNFIVSGTCSDTSIRSLRFIVRQNSDSALIFNQIISTHTEPTFSINIGIPAALADYDLEIYSTRTHEIITREKEVKKLVAGDYFIVTGQSNAAGALNDVDQARIEDSLYGNRYCRTIGNYFKRDGVDSLFDNAYDLSYHEVSSLFWTMSGKGCIGIWPMRIMHNLIKQTGVPLCILNGAVGATELSYHMASYTPSDPNKLYDTAQSTNFYPYDRLFRRLYTHSVISGVKAVFWYQGESDGALTKEMAQTYSDRFALLRKSWKLDYPNLEKIFVFQINTGCGGDYPGIIRDQQRKLATLFKDVIVLPTVGSTSEERDNDGCHYTAKGYGKLGENMSLPVLKYLYGFNIEDKYILGPDIKQIVYTQEDEICLVFNMDVTVELSQHYTFQNEGTAYLKDYFYNEDGKQIPITSIYADSNRVYLKIPQYTPIKTLTYLPHVYSTIPTTYMGPWILNKNNKNLGALSFFEFPVQAYEGEFWLNKTDSLVCYPNPVSDYLELRLRNRRPLNKLFLYDVSGKIVLNIPTDWIEKTRIDMSAFESGIYFLKAESMNGTLIKKVCITR